MAAKVGSSSLLQGIITHDKLNDSKQKQPRPKIRKTLKVEVSNEPSKNYQQACEQNACGAAVTRTPRGAARVAAAAAAAAAEVVVAAQRPCLGRRMRANAAAAGQANYQLSPTPSKRCPMRYTDTANASSTPCGSPTLRERHHKNTSQSPPLPKDQPSWPKYEAVYDCCKGNKNFEQKESDSEVTRENEAVKSGHFNMADGEFNLKASSNKNSPTQIPCRDASNNRQRALSAASAKRQCVYNVRVPSPSNSKFLGDISRVLVDQFAQREGPLQMRSTLRHFRSLSRSVPDPAWNSPTSTPRVLALPAERPDAVADAAGDAESRAARNFGATETSRPRRSRGPDGPSALPPPPPPSRASDHKRGGSTGRQRQSRPRREDRRAAAAVRNAAECGWRPWPSAVPPSLEVAVTRPSGGPNTRESPLPKGNTSRNSRHLVMEAKFVEAPSRDHSRFRQGKGRTNPRGASSNQGGGSGSRGSGLEGRGTRRKSTQRYSGQGKTKKTRQTDLSPKWPSKPNLDEDVSNLALSRHLRDSLEVWEDLVVDKGDKKHSNRFSGRAKLKKYRVVTHCGSLTELGLKNGESRKEKSHYHIKQVNKETVDRENVKTRSTERPKKSKDASKATPPPEPPCSPQLKTPRKKTIFSESKLRNSSKSKRDEKRDRTDKSLSQSTEHTASPPEESQKTLVAPKETRDTHKTCDRPRSPSLLAESNSKSYVTCGDSICVGDTKSQPDGKLSEELNVWQLPLKEVVNPCGGKVPHDSIWSALVVDECSVKDFRPETRVSRRSRSTCRGASGDEISHRVKGGSISSVGSRASIDTSDSPNRALTPGLTAEERADLEAGNDVFTPVDTNVRVRSSTNPRYTEESSYSARSRSVSAGTSITRNRYKKLTRKRRGGTSLRCNDASARYTRSPQFTITRSELPVKLSPTGRGRRSTTNAMISCDKTFYVASNRKSPKEHRTKRFHKYKPSLSEGKRGVPGHKFEVRMSLGDVDGYEENLNDLDWKLDFAMDAALRVAGLRESDSQPDSSPTIISSQECDSMASKDDYTECKDTVWCPFVRRPLSAVPEEDSHCSSSNKENPNSEFDLELMLKRRTNANDESAINAVLNQLFRDSSGDAIASEYEPTLTDRTDLLRASPSTLTIVPKSSDTTINLLQNKMENSSTEQVNLGSTSIVYGNMLEATSTVTTIMPRTTESDSRTDVHQTTEKSSDVILEKPKYGTYESSPNTLHVNTLESTYDTNCTRNTSMMSSRTLDEIVRAADSTNMICDKISTAESQENNNNECVGDTDTRLVKVKENDSDGINVFQINVSKPGVFIALDTLLMQYEESYSSSSANLILDPKTKKSKNKWVQENNKENDSSSSSHSQSCETSDNTFENVKSIPKSIENGDTITETHALQCESKDKTNHEEILEGHDVDAVSIHSGNSIFGDKQSYKQNELEIGNVSSDTSSTSSHIINHPPISRKKMSRPNSSANHCLPPKNTAISPTTNLIPLPDRFVVQEGGTFKEPTTPFKFVLTVNLHGPTHFDSSVDGSDECEKESSSSRSSVDDCLENTMSHNPQRKDQNLGRYFRNDSRNAHSVQNASTLSELPKLTTTHDTPCSRFLEKVENLNKSNLTSSSGYVCDSECSDSDRPSTIPSVLNLEDTDEGRITPVECQSLLKPNKETIESISNFCEQWRQSLGRVEFSDEDSVGKTQTGTKLSRQECKTESLNFWPKELPSLQMNTSIPISYENHKSEIVEHSTLVDISPQKTRRKVPLKLFSDWDVINDIIDQSGMDRHFSNKESIPGDLTSNTSSFRKSSTSTVTCKSSLKRKRPSKSSRRERGFMRPMNEKMKESTEDISSPSSISHAISISGADDGGKAHFHFLPRLVREEIARDKRALMRQSVSVPPFVLDDLSSEIAIAFPKELMGSTSTTFIPSEREDSILVIPNELCVSNELILNNECIEDLDQVDDEYYRDLFYKRDNIILAQQNDYQKSSTGENGELELPVVGGNMSRCDLNKKVSEYQYNQFNDEKTVVLSESTSPGKESTYPQPEELKNDPSSEENNFKQEDSFTTCENVSLQSPSEHTAMDQIIHNQNVLNEKKYQTLDVQNKDEELAMYSELKNKGPLEGECIPKDETKHATITLNQNKLTPSNEQPIPMLNDQTSNDVVLSVPKQDSYVKIAEVNQTNESDFTHVNRAILEGVALTMLLDAATVINKLMKGPGIICENKTISECDGQKLAEMKTLQKDTSINVNKATEVNRKDRLDNTSLRTCDQMKDLQNTKGAYQKAFESDTKRFISKFTETDSKFEASSSSVESTDGNTSAESCSNHNEPNKYLPATSSKNISVFVSSSIWEDVGISYMDLLSEDKTRSSTTRKTSNEEVLVKSQSVNVNLERQTSTQTNTSDWETISQSLAETAEDDKELEHTKVKVLESLWRCSSRREASDWDTSTETIGLIRPLASFASAPATAHVDSPLPSESSELDGLRMRQSSSAGDSTATATATAGGEMQLVFMRDDVSFAESDDSVMRGFAWGNSSTDSVFHPALLQPPPAPNAPPPSSPPPQSSPAGDTTTQQSPPLPPPLSLGVSCKSEAVQVTFPERSNPPSESIPSVSRKDDTSLEQIDAQHSSEHKFEKQHMDDIIAPNHPQITSSIIPAFRTKLVINSTETHNKDTANEVMYMTTETAEELATETDQNHWLQPQDQEHKEHKTEHKTLELLSYESSVDSESDSDALDTIEELRLLGVPGHVDRHLNVSRQCGQRRHTYTRQSYLGAHHMFLSTDVTKPRRDEGTDFTNCAIAFLCLAFAIVVMNSILCANNIIVFK